jgi:hypothetical protein
MNIEVLRLIDIRGPELTRSTRGEFEKRQQYALELVHRSQKKKTENQLLYLIFNDVCQLDSW